MVDCGSTIANSSWRVCAPLKLPLARAHLSKNSVLDDGEVGQGRQFEFAVVGHLGHVRAAGPACLAVDGHGAGAAHADAAGVAVRKVGVDVALDMGHHVQHGLAFETGHVVGDEIAFFLAAPDFNLQIGCHVDPACW
jgi:hypothetical protein